MKHIVLILKIWLWALCMGTWGVGTFGFATLQPMVNKGKKMKVNAALEWEDVQKTDILSGYS